MTRNTPIHSTSVAYEYDSFSNDSVMVEVYEKSVRSYYSVHVPDAPVSEGIQVIVG